MPKIIVCQGIPASGKTTWAKKFVNDNSDWIRINRDDIRNMFGKYWLPKRERLIETVEYDIAEEAIHFGWNIIVDDTNLNPNCIETWKQIADINQCDIEFKEFKISLEDALERDRNRDNSVGEDVIRNFYHKYYEN